jgi:hypothetical protein
MEKEGSRMREGNREKEEKKEGARRKEERERVDTLLNHHSSSCPQSCSP